MTQTVEQLKQVYYDTYTTLNPNTTPSIQGTDTYFKANANANIIANAIMDTQQMGNNIFPASSTGAYLDKHAGNLGMTPRQPALPSQGNATNLVANTGSTAAAEFTIPKNTKLTSNSTNQVYITTIDVSIQNGANLSDIRLPIQSVTLGAGTNSPANDTLTFVTPFIVPGTSQTIISAKVSSSGMTSGADIESNNDFALRIFQFMINPRGGGSIGDYRKWCFLGSPNVTNAEVFTTSQGNAGILYPVIFEGSNNPNYYIDGNANNNYTPTPAPINRTAPVEDVNAVQQYINTVRPVNDNPNVETVITYLLSSIDPVFGNGSYFTVNISLSTGITLNTNIQTSGGSFISIHDLIKREFRRAILQTPPKGILATVAGNKDYYIIVTGIEDIIMLGMGNTPTVKGNYASALLSLSIDYHPQGSSNSTKFIPVPSLKRGNLFVNSGGNQFAYLVYDIDVSMINIQVV